MFKHYLISCAAIGLFILAISCDSPSGPRSNLDAQTPAMFAVKVLLDENAAKISFNARGDYRVIDPETTVVINEIQSPAFITIVADGNGIKAGFKKYNSKRLIFQPALDTPFAINDNQPYHGYLEIIVNPDKKTFMVINGVSLEDYIAGVVASEMPSYWETEALKAQAIAARTYVLYIKTKFGKNRPWDVKATQASQVYKGMRAETMRSNDAVNGTAGKVINCQMDDWDLFPTYYSSVCGGHTEDSVNVFGDEFFPLQGVDCPYCRFNTRPSLFFWPDAAFDKKTVNDNIFAKYPSLKELGTIDKIEPEKVSTYPGGMSRIISVRLTGSTGKIGYLRGEDLRLSIDPSGSKIQSTCCTIISLRDEVLFIAGKGFGHGVGMCQYGAREMARQGKTAEEILNYYYPGNRIKRLY
ncbi:MAG: SpoIID/LytB domain-containing protein [Phycisphaerales bacterium]